jgi:hypothetical protein
MEIESNKDRTVFDFDFAALKGRRIIDRFVVRVVSPSEEFDQLCSACGDDLGVDDFPGSLVWVTRRRDGGVGYERYHQSDAAEFRVPLPPPAIGSSDAKRMRAAKAQSNSSGRQDFRVHTRALSAHLCGCAGARRTANL